MRIFNKIKHKNVKGFTLIEVLVSSMILAIIMTALMMVYTMGQHSWFSGDASVGLREQTMRAIAKMTREISATAPSKINLGIGSSGSSLIFPVPQDNNYPPDQSIVDNNSQVEWSRNITYSLVGEQIKRSVSSEDLNGNDILDPGEDLDNDGEIDLAEDLTIANNINSLLFTRSSEKILQIDITARKTTRFNQLMGDTEQILVQMRN
jgi:prepilin-type N-terminal cleavage/methylation domain-containing protein